MEKSLLDHPLALFSHLEESVPPEVSFIATFLQLIACMLVHICLHDKIHPTVLLCAYCSKKERFQIYNLYVSVLAF